MSSKPKNWVMPEVESGVVTVPPKLCLQCKNVLPPTLDFWDELTRFGEPVGYVCKRCKTPAGLAIRALEEKSKIDAKGCLDRLVAAAHQNRLECPSFISLTAELVAEFGGPTALCQEWVEQIRACKPGSTARLRAYEAIARMVDSASKHSLREVTDLNDKELREELTELLSTKLRVFAPEEADKPNVAAG
jgi:hypothetical protein